MLRSSGAPALTRYSGSVWSSYHDEPWAPEMQAVAEDEEGEAVDAKTLAEMSALSFRPGLTTEPVTRLTQVHIHLPTPGGLRHALF